MLTVAILFTISTLAAFLIFWLWQSKIDKKTWINALIFAVVGAATGALGWVFRKPAELSLSITYLLLVLLALGVGYWMLWRMYRLFWSVRDQFYWERDSVAKETAYAAFVAQLFALSAMGVYWALVRSDIEASVYWNLCLPALLPFISTKLVDLYQHIPVREYEHRWYYELNDMDPARWNWDHRMIVRFNVIDAYANENKWRPKQARFFIEAPRTQAVKMVYRLGLQVYHDRNPSIPVQDLGYEVNPPQFWWLFYIKFNLFDPKTWFPAVRYLDPNGSLEQNRLTNGMVITAKRIASE